MSKFYIPYPISNAIRDAFNLHAKFYRTLEDVMHCGPGLQYLRQAAKLDPAAEGKLIDFVLRRTLPFGKPAEFIPARHYRDGLPQCCVAGTGSSRWTICRHAEKLEDVEILFRMHFSAKITRTALFCLDWPKILEKIHDHWQELLMETYQVAGEIPNVRLEPRPLRMQQHWKNLLGLREYLGTDRTPFDHFVHLALDNPIKDPQEVIDKLEEFRKHWEPFDLSYEKPRKDET